MKQLADLLDCLRGQFCMAKHGIDLSHQAVTIHWKPYQAEPRAHNIQYVKIAMMFDQEAFDPAAVE